MANEKISDMAAASANALTDILPVVQAAAPTVNKKTTLQKVRDLFAEYFAVAATVTAALLTKVTVFSGANTAEGESSVTINAASGLAVFTQSIGSGQTRPCTIESSLFVAGQKISPELEYDSESGIPVIASHTITTGTAVIRVYNASSDTATDSNLKVKFQIS